MDVLQEQDRAAVETQYKTALIVFVKNPVLGKVKTRLAATAGQEKALEIYQELLQHTLKQAGEVEVSKFVFYSDFIPAEDEWKEHGFQQQLQTGDDLGEKMKNAFGLLFEMGFKHVVIIGSDCIELTTTIISEVYKKLQEKDIVIGPANDGGYYLLGMKSLHDYLFENKKWSTASVFADTVEDCIQKNLSISYLPKLNDIDTESDWREHQLKFKTI